METNKCMEIVGGKVQGHVDNENKIEMETRNGDFQKLPKFDPLKHIILFFSNVFPRCNKIRRRK